MICKRRLCGFHKHQKRAGFPALYLWQIENLKKPRGVHYEEHRGV